MKVQSNKIVNMQFSRGYGKKLKAKAMIISSKLIEQKINKNTLIKADFNNNKSIALANYWSYNILQNIGWVCGVNVSVPPPQIKVFKRSELADVHYPNSFCITKANMVLNNSPPISKKNDIFCK